MQYYVKAFQNYAKFDGRATRPEFWYFFLFNLVIGIVLAFVDGMIGTEGMLGSYGLLSGLYMFAVLVPALAVGARRLHDTGKSGWWQLLGFIPVIGVIVLIVFWAMAGQEKENMYGPVPGDGEAMQTETPSMDMGGESMKKESMDTPASGAMSGAEKKEMDKPEMGGEMSGGSEEMEMSGGREE